MAETRRKGIAVEDFLLPASHMPDDLNSFSMLAIVNMFISTVRKSLEMVTLDSHQPPMGTKTFPIHKQWNGQFMTIGFLLKCFSPL